MDFAIKNFGGDLDEKIFLLSALLMIFIFSVKVNAAANCVWVYSDDYETIWIDNNSIGHNSNGFFAYFKINYSDAGRNREIESWRKRGLSVSEFYNLSYDISFNYFKNLGKIKYLSNMGWAEYDKNGKILDSWSDNNFNWHRIIPDSMGEVKYDAVYARVWR